MPVALWYYPSCTANKETPEILKVKINQVYMWTDSSIVYLDQYAIAQT